MSTTEEHHNPVMTAQGRELLESLDIDSDDVDVMNLTLRRQGWDAETVAAVLTQMDLRRKARGKFGDRADRMLLTREGLQQSTRSALALRHAARFTQAGVTQVADLGCGLGSDAMALAEQGLEVTAVEADADTAAMARANLEPYPGAQVVHGTAEEWVAQQVNLNAAAPDGLGLWLDPARRDEQSRTWNPEDFSPPLSFVLDLASTGIPLGVKLGPGIRHDLIPPECEAEWVSLDGELLEVVLWFNALADRTEHGTLVRRRSTVLSSGTSGAAQLTSTTDFGDGMGLEPTGTAGLHGVIWEPDPAVIRAGLVAELCEQFGGRLLDEHIAYFCTDKALDNTQNTQAHDVVPMARGFKVLEVLNYSPKRLKRWCAEQQVTSVEIKKRGVDVVPEQLRRQILPKKKPKQRKHATLILARVGDDRLAAVVDPL